MPLCFWKYIIIDAYLLPFTHTPKQEKITSNALPSFLYFPPLSDLNRYPPLPITILHRRSRSSAPSLPALIDSSITPSTRIPGLADLDSVLSLRSFMFFFGFEFSPHRKYSSFYSAYCHVTVFEFEFQLGCLCKACVNRS